MPDGATLPPVLVGAQSGTVAVPYNAELAAFIPHAQVVEYAGQKLLVMPHGLDETRLLQNFGLPAPSPILANYDWNNIRPGPFASQRMTAAMLTVNPRAYVLNDMGTGKTRAVCFALHYLWQTKAIRRTLVAAPLSTLVPVWEREFMRHFPAMRVRVLLGDKAKRLQRFAEEADVYIINHHGLPVLQKEIMARDDLDAVVIDELAVFRNARTQLWKAAATTVAKRKYAWGMTGAPTPKAPTDAHGQIRLITPERAPRSFGQWQDMTMRQITQFKWGPRPDANKTVFLAMQPAVRYRREEVVELPPTTYDYRDVALSARQQEVYQALDSKARMFCEQGNVITPANEGVVMGKLLQVAAGSVYNDKGQVFTLDCPERFDMLEEIIEQCDRKLIVFAPFKHTVDRVFEHLRAKGLDVAKVYGDTPTRERDQIFLGFETADRPRYLVAHPQCMAHGLTLVSADTIVWWSPYADLDIYAQANARITRPGQTAKTFLIHLQATKEERLVYSRLKRRQSLQGALLALYEGKPDEGSRDP